MSWFNTLTGILAPIFIIVSPVLSYGDQAMSMHRNKSSAGFSLDIPLIMLVASCFRIAYWPGARFDGALLVQSLMMIVMQLVLLKIALDHRPAPSSKGGEAGVPFAGVQQEETGFLGGQRPYNFWQWRSHKPYWQFLVYLIIGLVVCELVLTPLPPIYTTYSVLIGYLGLSVEATLPIPQILSNMRSKSSRGLRLSVLAAWLLGDAMKLYWFFTATTEIPAAFKICGSFQAACDCLLGVQYWLYRSSEGGDQEYSMSDVSGAAVIKPGLHSPTRSLTPTRRHTMFSDKSSD